MTGVRRLYLDAAPGERRGVVFLDGEPEQLFLERAGEPPAPEPGQRTGARVRRTDAGLGLAFLDLDGGGEAALSFGRGSRPGEGAHLKVEVVSPPRRGKAATVRLAGAGEVSPSAPALSLEARLGGIAPGMAIETGAAAREAADEAEAAVLAIEHRLAGGASLAVESTRALVAVDVDLGAAAGGDPRRSAARVNALAIAAAARLLRLKGLGGLVVIDLVGRGQDGAALSEIAKAAFAADMPGVAVGPISRFGTLTLSLPWRRGPVIETLCAADGRLSARTVAQRLARALEREGRADPGARLDAVASPEVAAELEPLVAMLGPRFSVREEPGRDRLSTDIRAHG